MILLTIVSTGSSRKGVLIRSLKLLTNTPQMSFTRKCFPSCQKGMDRVDVLNATADW